MELILFKKVFNNKAISYIIFEYKRLYDKYTIYKTIEFTDSQNQIEFLLKEDKFKSYYFFLIFRICFDSWFPYYEELKKYTSLVTLDIGVIILKIPNTITQLGLYCGEIGFKNVIFEEPDKENLSTNGEIKQLNSNNGNPEIKKKSGKQINRIPNNIDCIYLFSKHFSFNYYYNYKCLRTFFLCINSKNDVVITKNIFSDNSKNLYLLSYYSNIIIEKGSIDSVTHLAYTSSNYCIEQNALSNSLTDLTILIRNDCQEYYDYTPGIHFNTCDLFYKIKLQNHLKYNTNFYPSNLIIMEIVGKETISQFGKSFIVDNYQHDFIFSNKFHYFPLPKTLKKLMITLGNKKESDTFKFFNSLSKTIFENIPLETFEIDYTRPRKNYGKIDKNNHYLKDLDISILPPSLKILNIAGKNFVNN
ncbi:hypothetical protein ACTA71_006872 [Dictyostelium dimigraforme]